MVTSNFRYIDPYAFPMQSTSQGREDGVRDVSSLHNYSRESPQKAARRTNARNNPHKALVIALLGLTGSEELVCSLR